MPIKILMPALSPTMTEGNLAKWHIKEGDKVSAGDLIAEIETDKATMEVEAVDEGKVGKILVKEGAKNVLVNSVIALLLEDGEAESALESLQLDQAPLEKKIDESKDVHAVKSVEITNQAANILQTNTPAHSSGLKSNVNERVFASPLAKRIAAEKNIDVSRIQGSGPKGRVIKNDVINSSSTSAGFSLTKGQVTRSHPETSKLPVSTMRQVIAGRLLDSKQNVPHFYLSVDCKMDKLLEMRQDINTLANPNNPEFKISVNDLIIKASALALKAVPEANASWGNQAITKYNNIDVAVAVAISGGLITPIVRNADQKSIFAISEEMRELVGKAKAGTLTPAEFQGGGFSISNLGMFNIKQFSAIINPPQSCILAVGATEERAIVDNGEIGISNMMTLTISCDHRVVDGAVGANLINAIKQVIEKPVRMMI